MKYAEATGIVFNGKFPFPQSSVVAVRTETTGNFSTLSLADDDKGIMIQVAITPEIKKILRGVSK